MSIIKPTQREIDEIQEYIDTKAKDFYGMSYSEGLQEMVDWLMGYGPMPGTEDE